MSEPVLKTIAVFGATGQQGGSVVRALQSQGEFRVRAITRDASRAEGLADEVVSADLTRPETLGAALQGAHGVFAVTNAWAGPGVDEFEQGKAAIAAAKQEGVRHFVWSTLPNVEQIADGRFNVHHFTQKAKVDDLVIEAEFDAHTFVEAPFYFQNLKTVMQPQPREDGGLAWAVPINPDAKVTHMGDITQLGHLVAGAFANPEMAGSGQHLALNGQLLSWSDIVDTLKKQGHNVAVDQVPGPVYDSFFEGASELREMMEYFEAQTYFGPEADKKISLARKVSTEQPTDFETWAKTNIGPGDLGPDRQ